jgi:DNA-binding beta-propeller fold protein YncE
MAIPTSIKSILTKLETSFRAELSASAPVPSPSSVNAQVVDYLDSANAAIIIANANSNAYLTKAERSGLPELWRHRIEALGAAATPATPAPSPTAPAGLFGIAGTMPPAALEQQVILNNGLEAPTSLAFNSKDDSLWVVCRDGDSSIVIDDAGKTTQKAVLYRDDSAHFMNNPMQIAFSRRRDEFAIVGDTTNDYNSHHDHGNFFMGPTLYPANRAVYDGRGGTHLDMLHHSPNGGGIVAGKKTSSLSSDKREYWVFNGHSGAIDRYFFHQPHALGADDHADGKTYRYAEGELQRVAGVPGHLALDEASGYLYVADTGNGRIARLDTSTSLTGARLIPAYHDETPLFGMAGTTLDTVASGLGKPSGLVFHDGKLVVSEHATGRIKILSLGGELLGDYNTGRGANSITGLAVSKTGELYFTDMKRNEVVKLLLPS